MVLVGVERVKMVCRSAGAVVDLECFQRDLIIQRTGVVLTVFLLSGGDGWWV